MCPPFPQGLLRQDIGRHEKAQGIDPPRNLPYGLDAGISEIPEDILQQSPDGAHGPVHSQ